MQSELAHTRTKTQSSCRTNKKDITKQLADIDFVEREVRRMAEELRVLDIPLPDVPTTTPPAISQTDVQFRIANEPETRLFLSQLIMDHRDDHAYQVCALYFTTVHVSHHQNRTLSHL